MLADHRVGTALWALALLAGLGVFSLYAVTLAPTTAFWDTSEYIATAHEDQKFGLSITGGQALAGLLAVVVEGDGSALGQPPSVVGKLCPDLVLAGRLGLVSPRVRRQTAEKWIKELSIKVSDPENPVALPRITVEEPTMMMIFKVNDGPLAGKEGKFVPSRNLRERLYREAPMLLMEFHGSPAGVSRAPALLRTKTLRSSCCSRFRIRALTAV